MLSDVLPVALPRTSFQPPVLSERARDTDRLGDAIAELAARLHAATYELLVLIREFDAAGGWNTGGCLSCAHWLNWRTGIDLGAAREKVRVAKALADLPLISAAMQRGELSYSKVRAVTRVAAPESETRLLQVAQGGTAAHVEQIVRAWRRVDRQAAAQMTGQRHVNRSLTTWVDDDGMLVIRGRLPPEVGAVVQRALEAAADQLFKEAAQSPDGGQMAEEVSAGQRRADALARVAERALAALDHGTTGDRYQVIVHIEATATAQAAQAPATGDAEHAVVELGHGATCLSAETSQRIACDASLVVMQHAADGSVLDVGRRRRTVPTAIRRALEARDRHCQYPGCTARRCDAHHLKPWALGGRTSLTGTLLLCRRHHRAVHEGGFRVERGLDGDITWFRPDGKRLEFAPPSPRWARRDPRPLGPTIDRMAEAGHTVGPHTTTPTWGGERLDLGWAIDVLRS